MLGFFTSCEKTDLIKDCGEVIDKAIISQPYGESYELKVDFDSKRLFDGWQEVDAFTYHEYDIGDRICL